MLPSSRFSPSLAPSLLSVNVQVCGFFEWHSVLQVKLVAQLLTWLVNGCYLWEGGVDSANIAHSRSTFLPLVFPLPLSSPLALLLMIMAVMTEEMKRRHKKKYRDGEIWEGKREKAGNGKTSNAGKPKGVGKKGCKRSSGSFIKTIIVQDLRIPPGAGVHVEAHIIN